VTNTGSTSTSYTASGLTNGTLYKFRVRANNGTAGDGDWSASSTATPAGSANFKSPTASWTSIFGATTSTSGGAATPYAASVSGFTFEGTETVTAARSGTLRVTGTVTADDAFILNLNSAFGGFSAGDNNGTVSAAINFSVSVNNGYVISFSCSNATISNLRVWLV
jgi:hypothetical protein